MKKYILTAKEDLETGEIGYLLEGIPQISYPMVSTEGLQIAHDILEHVNGLESIGSIDDELQALAGVWFVRGQFGDMSRKGYSSMYSAEENLASDVLNMARIYNNGVNFRTEVPKTKSHYLDDTFYSIIELAKKGIVDEIDDDEINQSRLDFYFDSCIHYLRSGYRKIERKWEDAAWINNIFWSIAVSLDNYGMDPDFECHQIELKFCMTRCRVFIEEYYPNDEYY